MTRSEFLELAVEVYDEHEPTTKAEYKETIQALFDELRDRGVDGIDSEDDDGEDVEDTED